MLITTDQQHFQALGCRTPALKTPNLDRLAVEGMLFDRAYCPNPLCSPSRSSLITGQYPSTHGCWTIGTKLDEERQTIGQLLGDNGYATSLIGKAHFQPLRSLADQTSLEAPPTLRDLDFWKGFSGPYYGFEHIELARNHADEAWAGQHYALWMEANGLADWRQYFQGDGGGPPREHCWDLPEEFHYTTFVAERTVAAIDRAALAGRPFFTWASFQDPHPPYLVPEPWASMYDPADLEPGRLEPGELDLMPPWFAKTQEADPDFSEWQETPHFNHGFSSHLVDESELRKNIAVYYGMISFVDHAVGRILARLDELGVNENTLVVFTTDHGHFLGQHGLTAKGAFHYEDLLRIPMIARYPGRIPAGSRSAALQSLVDLAPTFLSAAGLAVPGDMQGVDQLPVWTGQQPAARDHVLVENRHQPTAVHIRTYVDDRYKLTVYRDKQWGELFDLVEDPQEHRNQFGNPSYEPIRAELMRRFLNAELRREASRFARIAIA
ncbi:sulfatase family protein [Kribbella aluminosa]|uniref:sulfatase family protein n=1 Tax=Kribbella aluminosa TaxID=416017 RepID=UPI0031D91DE5